MRVLISAIASAQQPSGVCRHAMNLARCLLQRDEVTHVDLVVGEWQYKYYSELLHPRSNRLHLSVAGVENSAMSRNRWFYSELPKTAKSFGSDIVHATYPIPLNRSRFSCPVVVTLHDLYPYDIPQNWGYPRVFMNRAILRQCLAAADSITCVSQSTLDRLEGMWPSLALRKAVRIYNCVEPGPSAGGAPLPYLRDESFLLAIAQHRRNKNLPLTIRVFQRLLESHPSMRLLIVGNEGPETPAIHALIRDAGLQSRVILVSGISDVQLQWCYRNCMLLLATSVVEGFGLPVAEAMLAGCKVVCSNIPVLRELACGNCHCVPLGPDELEDFVNAIRLAIDEPLAPPLSMARLSINEISGQYVLLYEDLILTSRKKKTLHAPLVSAAMKVEKGGLS